MIHIHQNGATLCGVAIEHDTALILIKAYENGLGRNLLYANNNICTFCVQKYNELRFNQKPNKEFPLTNDDTIMKRGTFEINYTDKSERFENIPTFDKSRILMDVRMNYPDGEIIIEDDVEGKDQKGNTYFLVTVFYESKANVYLILNDDGFIKDVTTDVFNDRKKKAEEKKMEKTISVLQQLKEKNASRCERYGHGLFDWSLQEWTNALAGEVGELCNVSKKIKRGDYVKAQPTIDLALGDEIADVLIYLDLVCQRAGLDLETEMKRKFNQDSEKRGFPEKFEI